MFRQTVILDEPRSTTADTRTLLRTSRTTGDRFVDRLDYVFMLVCRFAICYHRASQEHVSGVHRLGCYYYLCRLQNFVLWQQRFIVTAI